MSVYTDKIAHLQSAVSASEAVMKTLREDIKNFQQQIDALYALDRARMEAESVSEASEAPQVSNHPMGYRKSATGAMEGRTVQVLNVTVGQKSESRAFWPDYAPVGNEHRTRTNKRPAAVHQPGKFCLCEACNTGYFDGDIVEDIRIDPPYDR